MRKEEITPLSLLASSPPLTQKTSTAGIVGSKVFYFNAVFLVLE